MAIVPIPTEINDDELWGWIFGAGAIGEYSWWYSCKFLDETDDETAGAVELVAEDPEGNDEDDSVTKIITIQDLVKAINELGDMFVYRQLAQEDVDCDGADRILQKAMYGSVVFG